MAFVSDSYKIRVAVDVLITFLRFFFFFFLPWQSGIRLSNIVNDTAWHDQNWLINDTICFLHHA